MKLISEEKFEPWKTERSIPKDVLYIDKTSYLGLRLRSRPGVFFLTSEEIVHWSYSPKDCGWAAFEKEAKTVFPIKDIVSIRIEKLPLFWSMAFAWAKWVIKLQTSEISENIILYEKPNAFRKSAKKVGVACVKPLGTADARYRSPH